MVLSSVLASFFANIPQAANLRHAWRTALCILAGACLATAAGAQPRPPRVENPRAVFELQGISVHPPQGKDWYVLRRDRQAVFFGKKLDSDTHAFAATAVTQLIPRTFESVDEFREYVKQSQLGNLDPARHAVLENDAIIDQAAGRYCVRYHIKTDDRGAHKETLKMVSYGLACMHPTIPQLFVEVGYSERGREGELDPELRAEGASLVRSLNFLGTHP